MPKKILLIENDPAFAAQVSEVLEGNGFDVRSTGDGKEGLDLAREWAPEAVVLCVELPAMSGYLVCQKLRKDDALKEIPLVLTSSEATPETFEKHRTLKARADEYLLKPYAPAELVEKLSALVGLPEADPDAAGAGDEELVSLEEEMGLEGLDTEPVADLPPFDLQSLPDEPTSDAGGDADEDLRLLDDAFDGLSAPPSPASDPADRLELDIETDRPVAAAELDAAAASLPDEDEGTARADLGALDADDALGALGLDDPAPDLADLAPPPPSPTRPSLRGASADALRAAGIRLLDDDDAPAAPPARASTVMAPRPVLAPAPPTPRSREDGPTAAAIQRLERDLADAQQALAEARGTATGRESELRQVRQNAEDAALRADEAESAAAEKDVELAALRARLDALQAQARKAESDGKAAREEARRVADQARSAEREVVELRSRAAETERRVEEAEARAGDAEADGRRKAEELSLLADSGAKADALERELEELRTELVVARGEVDGARGEVEERTAELRKRVAELEAGNAKNEERVLKAYQKIKNDEKVKDKVRKALAIAAQLLEEGLPAESPAEKARLSAAATLLGRE